MAQMTNTRQLTICPHCNCMTFTLMDDDGNRFCGKCKEPKPATNPLLRREAFGGTYDFKLEDGHAFANVAIGDDWATVYLVETDPKYRNRGEATKLLAALKKKMEEKGKTFRLWAPMNDVILGICKKLDIEIVGEEANEQAKS